MQFGVYQHWVHQNTGNHIDAIITEDGKWQARWEKLVCMSTQCYKVPPGKDGRIFFGTLYVELNDVQYWKWKSKSVIVFQSIILQCAQGVNNYKHIRAYILF